VTHRHGRRVATPEAPARRAAPRATARHGERHAPKLTDRQGRPSLFDHPTELLTLIILIGVIAAAALRYRHSR